MFVGKMGANFAAGEPTLAKAAAVGEIPGSEPSAVVVRAAPLYCDCDHNRGFWEHSVCKVQNLMQGLRQLSLSGSCNPVPHGWSDRTD